MNLDFFKLSKEERELRLTALALGELASIEAEEIHQAIAADAELEREFDRLKQTVDLVRETAAMDRRVSPEGVPLRLDEARRQKLLEAFKTPAPRAIEPRRRRKLWFVPLSAAAAVVGLLIAAMAFPHMRGERQMERLTMLSADRSDGVVAGESVSKRLLERLFDQPSVRANLDGRPQDSVTLAELTGTETPAPKPVPLLKATKSLAIALPAGGDKDGDGWEYSKRRSDLGAAWKPAEAVNEFSMPSDFQVGRDLEVDRKATGLKGVESARSGALSAPAITTTSGRQSTVRGTDVDYIVTDLDADQSSAQPGRDSAARHLYLGNEYKTEGLADNTRSPQQTPPVSSITLNEVMYNPIPESPPVLAQADGRMNNSSVTVNFSEAKGRVAALQPEENAPVGSRPFGEPTWIGMVDRPVATTAPATPPPANAPEQAGVYSVNAVGYVNLDLKSGYNLITNPLNGNGDSVELFKAGDAVVNYAKEAKPASGGNIHWDINGAGGVVAGQEFGLSRPNAQSLGVTPPAQPAERDGIKADDYEKTPHPESTEALATTATGPNRTEAAKLVQDGKLFYEAGRLKEAEDALRQATRIDSENKGAAYFSDLVTAKKYETEARLREIGSKQLLTEVEQSWASPVSRPRVGGQAGAGPTFVGGGAPYAQDSIAPSGRGGGGGGGGGRANKTSGISGDEFFGGNAGQPAKPEIQIAIGDLDSLSKAGGVVAMTPQQLTMDAKFANVNQDDSRASGFDSARGNIALKNQSLDQDRSVRSANLATIYRDSLMDGVAGVPARSDDGTVVFQNSYTASNALVSNNSWGLPADNALAFNDSSFGKDGREKLSAAGKYTFSFGDQQVSKDEKPVSVDYAVSGSLVVPDGSATNGTLYSLTLAEDTVSSLAEFPATAGGKTFGALGSGVAPQGPANGRGFGVAQSQPGGGGGVGGFGRSGFGNRLNSAVRRLEGATVATTRGSDDFGTASTGAGDQTVRLVNGAVSGFEIQLPAQAKEEPLNRQSSPARPPNEGTTAHFFGPRNLIGEDLLGVDAAGLPIADVEAKVKKLDQVALRGEGIVAEDKLEEKKASASPAEAGKPMASGGAGVQLRWANPSPTMVTNAAGISVAPESLRGLFKPDVVAPGAIIVSALSKDTGINAEKKAADSLPAKPSTPAPTPQPEVLARDDAFSTFSLNVSDVSFKLAAASLEKGAMPELANIRSEEFINAFDYHDPMPAPGAPLAFAWERARYPFAHNRDVVRFSVKTAAQGRETGKPLNIVLLLDNSGSMERADRVRIIQESLRTLAAQLKPQDKLSVVTFSRTARLWADGVSGAQAAEVASKIATLTPEGGTNLEDALDLAYKTALRHYLATAVNRVVLLTDGAANLGNVEPKELKAKVEGFRKQGIALDCFGIGWEGFNDDLLEQLSRNGDGRYGFVNAPEEAASEFVGQLAGALRVAASDVKMQVEFNPKRVTAWRQIGYAKHQLTKQQFRDNKVDAAEIGAAESGNALYVIETNPNGQGPIATVRARFRVPQTSDYREHEWVVPFGSVVELEQSSPSLRLAAGASAFSEWLASSPFAGDVSTDRLLKIVSGVPETYGADPRPKKLEWMIRQAKSISGK